jgi:hypothetical protein
MANVLKGGGEQSLAEAYFALRDASQIPIPMRSPSHRSFPYKTNIRVNRKFGCQNVGWHESSIYGTIDFQAATAALFWCCKLHQLSQFSAPTIGPPLNVDERESWFFHSIGW